MIPWKKIQEKAELLNLDPTDFDLVLKREVLTLIDLQRALKHNVTPESIEEQAKEIQEFYKEFKLWPELPEDFKRGQKAIVPFPELLGKEILALTEVIFKEKTKLLVRTVAECLKQQSYSKLNWWYFVKKLYPELDNQILIQFHPHREMSYMTASHSITMDLATFMRRGQDRGFYTSSVSKTILQYMANVDIPNPGHFQVQAPEEFQRVQLLFSPWALKKRLRLLSYLTFPMSQDNEDMLRMFMSVPKNEWSEAHFNTQPATYNRMYNMVSIDAIHDFILVLSRKSTMPFRSMDQKPVEFLEQETFGEFSIRIPKSNHDLDLISHRLNNCVGRAGYYDKVQAGAVFIIEVLQEGRSFACLEYYRPGRRFIQAKVNRNRDLTDGRLLDAIESKINAQLFPPLFPTLWARIKEWF